MNRLQSSTPTARARKLLTALFVALALVASALILVAGPKPADACKHIYIPRDTRPAFAKVGNRYEVRLNTYSRYYRFRGSNLRLQYVYVYSRDEKFARFVHRQGSQVKLWKVIQAAASRHSCADILEGRSLVKVEANVARALAAHYRRATRRTTRTPDVMLGIRNVYRVQCKP